MNEQKVPRERPGPKKLAQLEAKLRADSNTEQIATGVGLSLEEYVKQVMLFVANPEAEPEIYAVEDEELRKAGIEPPDPGAMISYLREAQELLEVSEVSKFTDKKKKKVELDSGARQLDEEFSDPGLKAALDSQLRGKRGGRT